MAGEDEGYLEWLRKQLCAACSGKRRAALRGLELVQAHHRTGAGMALRAHDHEAMPLCGLCHRDLHSSSGQFKKMGKDERKLWEQQQVAFYRERYLDA